MFEREDAVYAFPNAPPSPFSSWSVCWGVARTPATAKTLSHILRYSSIMLGTAGTVICVVTTARRYKRLTTASPNVDGLNDLTVGSSIRPLYTTHRCSTSARVLYSNVCRTPGI